MAKKGKGFWNNRIVQGAIMLLLGAAVAWAILTRFTSVLTTRPEEKVGTLSEVQTLATMNLDNSYPGTVDGVVTLFARIPCASQSPARRPSGVAPVRWDIPMSGR